MSCDSAHKTLPVLTGGAYLHLSEEWAERVGRQAKKSHGAVRLDKPLLSHFAVFGFVQPLSGGGLSGKITVDDWTDWIPERTAKKQGWTVMMDSDP